MSEQLDESQYIQDVNLAWELAHVEKPARDYLYDNPDLPRRDVIAISYEIGAVVMEVQRELTPRVSPSVPEDYWSYSYDNPEFSRKDAIAHAFQSGVVAMEVEWDHAARSKVPPFDPAGHWSYSSRRYEYKTVPVPERELKGSLLVAEWAQIPGMKLIDGRPVVGEDEMRAFTRRRIAAGEHMNKGAGVEVYGLIHGAALHDIEYIPGHPRHALQKAAGSLRFFDEDTAKRAGLAVREWGTYLDLFSLYEFASQLPALVHYDGKRWLFGLTPSKARFLTSFMSDILQLDESSDEA
jgi:hypothetical protein